MSFEITNIVLRRFKNHDLVTIHTLEIVRK